MRTRDWRKFQEERVLRNRIKKFCRRWYHFRTANGERILHPNWTDFVGLKEFFLYKNHSTTRIDSRYKVKYSPNRSFSYYRDRKPKKGFSFGIREKDKEFTRELINEYYEYQHDYTEYKQLEG